MSIRIHPQMRSIAEKINTVRLLGMLFAIFAGTLITVTPAHAANCYTATSQGSTGPADYSSYCWIDFSTYNDTAARSAAGQGYSLALQDGSTLSFTMKVSGSAFAPVTSPSWTGAAVGNTAFLGIGGQPILYQSASGTTSVTLSSITIIPPAGVQAITQYMMVAGDGESSNNGESLSFQTNGGNWAQLDQAGPISGSSYPTTSGTGTQTYTETGVAGTVGAYIVGSSTPTTLTTTLVGAGLQGAMFAVRFATIQLNTLIATARAAPADQFAFTIDASSNGAVLSSGASTGTGNGPFTAASLSSTSALPLTLNEALASGSATTIGHYVSKLTCTNATSGSTTTLPNNVSTTSYSFGALKYGDAVVCTFAETPYPHLTLQKAIAASGRQFATDQFTMNVTQGSTSVATTTTTGSGTTVTNGATPLYQATAATAYRFAEAASGTTVLAQYSAGLACTNAWVASSTALPSTVGSNVTPQIGDVITCTLTNTKLSANALLTITKTAMPYSDPANGIANPKLIPGGIVTYTFTVSNSGSAPVDNNSVWLIDALPSQLRVGTAAAPTFTQGTPTSGLTFNAATDLAYSNSSTPPATYSACSYVPISAYDVAVKYVCLNPKGTMAGSTGTPPNFQVSIRAQIQ